MAWLVLVQVQNKRERLLPVRPPGVEKTSRLRSRDPVASGVKCGPHGGKNSKLKSVGSFLVEPQNQGRARTSWELSHGWWLADATSSSRGLRWFTRKSLGYSAEPQSRAEDRVWLSGQNRPGLTGLGSQGAGSFEVEDTCRDRKACVEATWGAVAGHPSDVGTKTNSESALGGRVS
jgi:hypothetical protein